MIYISFSCDIPTILSSGPSAVMGPEGISADSSHILPSFSFSQFFFEEFFEITQSYVSIDSSFPWSGLLDSSFWVSVESPVPTYTSLSSPIPDLLFGSDFSLLYSPPVPVSFSASVSVPAFSFGLVFSFFYEPPPADYYISMVFSLPAIENFSLPIISSYIAAPSFVALTVEAPTDCGFNFFDFSFFSEFSVLFPRVSELLPDDAFLIAPNISVLVEAPALPAAQELPLPVTFPSHLHRVSLISPVFYPSVLDLPAFPSYPPAVLTYVYNSSYLTISTFLPIFPLEFLASSAKSDGLLSMDMPAPLIPFSGFSSVVSAFIQGPCFASVSRSIPPFPSAFSLTSDFGPAGLAIFLPDNFIHNQPVFVLSVPSPPDPIFLPVLRDLPAGFFVSPAVNNSAVWKVGVISFNFLVSGKKY